MLFLWADASDLDSVSHGSLDSSNDSAERVSIDTDFTKMDCSDDRSSTGTRPAFSLSVSPLFLHLCSRHIRTCFSLLQTRQKSLGESLFFTVGVKRHLSLFLFFFFSRFQSFFFLLAHISITHLVLWTKALLSFVCPIKWFIQNKIEKRLKIK